MVVAVIIIGVALIIAVSVIAIFMMGFRDDRAKRAYEYSLRELDTKENMAKAAMRYGVMKSNIRDISTYCRAPIDLSGSLEDVYKLGFRDGVKEVKVKAVDIIENTERGER